MNTDEKQPDSPFNTDDSKVDQETEETESDADETISYFPALPERQVRRQTLEYQEQQIRREEQQIRKEEMQYTNQNRRTILKFILGLFAIWIVLSLIRLLITGDIQVLTAGAAVLSGPLGVVIGYYYAQEEKDRSK